MGGASRRTHILDRVASYSDVVEKRLCVEKKVTYESNVKEPLVSKQKRPFS